MAKKTNKKPGSHKKEAAMMMKRKSRSLNQSIFAKVVLLLMVLAFIVPMIIQVILYLID